MASAVQNSQLSDNFATIVYDAHITTKIDYTSYQVVRSMTVHYFNNLFHTVCELERNQHLTILAMSVQKPQLAGFLLTGIHCNFLYVEGPTAWLYDCSHFLSPLYKPIAVSIVYLYTLKIPLCTLTLLQDKPLTMQLPLKVTMTLEILSN